LRPRQLSIWPPPGLERRLVGCARWRRPAAQFLRAHGEIAHDRTSTWTFLLMEERIRFVRRGSFSIPEEQGATRPVMRSSKRAPIRSEHRNRACSDWVVGSVHSEHAEPLRIGRTGKGPRAEQRFDVSGKPVSLTSSHQQMARSRRIDNAAAAGVDTGRLAFATTLTASLLFQGRH